MNEADIAGERYVAFRGSHRLAAGEIREVAVAVWSEALEHPGAPVLVFGPKGQPVDLDLRGTAEDVLARLQPAGIQAAAPRGRGRPKLGVTSREVTLLPRHWDWLSAQPGGASVTLRKLVDAARRDGAADEARRERRDAAYRFMSAVAGDLPGFEDASRALFAGDRDRLEDVTRPWPGAVRSQVLEFLGPGDDRAPSA